jgi:eukaryotic-like serine/threonine-protein kinase
MKEGGIFQFGEYQVDALARTLRRDKGVVTLTRRAFEVLLYLVQNPGRVIPRDELLKNVWPDAFVDENSLAQSISALRRALEEKPGDNNYIATLPGRGYQFVAPVQVIELASAGALSALSAGESPGEDRPHGIVLQRETIRTIITSTTEEKGRLALPPARFAWTKVSAILFVFLALALLAGIVGYVVHLRSARRHLSSKDSVVLADFTNRTGDSVFDDTLRTALGVALTQSPFLNPLSENKIRGTLRMMTRPPDTKLAPEVALEVCQRTHSKAYISGSIASLGKQYVLALEATNCESGDTLAREQATAAAKEKVLDALGAAAANLRSELGESLATVKKFDVPLDEATTASLDALKAYSLSDRFLVQRDPVSALPYSQRALELDPNFAMAYAETGIIYFSLDQQDRASGYFAKAFQMRERASEWEKLVITAEYYGYATGEIDKAIQALQEEIEIYPHGVRAYNGLAVLYTRLEQYEKSAEAAQQMLLFDPDDAFGFVNLALDDLAMQRFAEAHQTIQQAQGKKFDGYLLHNYLYALAFLQSDSSAMAVEQQWFARQPAYENYGLALAADTESYAGHVHKALELTKQAVGSALRTDNKEDAAVYEANAAVQQAAYGNTMEAQRAAAEALKLAPGNPYVDAEAALALAMSGDTARAQTLGDELAKRLPLDTQLQSLWVPAIHAQIELRKKNASSALQALQAALPIEFANIPFSNNTSCLYPTYIRGEAYLDAGQGAAAAAEFQKIIDHSGIVWNCWTGALARLGLARANALDSTTQDQAGAARARALAAYKDFFTLWGDADPDIPILKQAKSERERLSAAAR